MDPRLQTRSGMLHSNMMYQTINGLVKQTTDQLQSLYTQCAPQSKLVPYKALTELSNRILYGNQQHMVPRAFYFSQQDLDNVLYGYTAQKWNQGTCTHALSGLKVGEITHGIDRILSNSNNDQPSAMLLSPYKVSRTDPPPHDLPAELCICPTTFAGVVHYGVFCTKGTVPRGTRYGPFKGKIVNTSEIKSFDDNSYMWEIFKEGKLSHFIDGRGVTGNWMSYVNCARHSSEQNVTVIQDGSEIYYEVCRDITAGMEILVWYGEKYLQFMGIPVTMKISSEENEIMNKTDDSSRLQNS